jgi:murein DD-endopeptidase MepM/ murein hydrolase activator NlpD
MKKFYYFSKSKLKFVEIRNFYQKFVFLVLFFSILATFFVFGTFIVFNEYINPNSEVKKLKKTNSELKEKINSYAERYKQLDERINILTEKSHDLRLSANLEADSTLNQDYGIGGTAFTTIKATSPSKLANLLDEMDSYMNMVSYKVKLEKKNYNEIENTFKNNEMMYESIPAVKPCSGTLLNDFGMRLHPILKIKRMHNGVDIITDSGTKVYTTGGGKVGFVGWQNGLGLVVEIEHGFGYRTVYGHLQAARVKEGQVVNRGDLIALSGSSGSLATGPHLHYEVRHNGIPLNPQNFIYDDVDLFEIVKK